MAWRIGIDEAGYGPNLGPFVMTAVACRVPDDLTETCLWDALSNAVCRRRRKTKREDRRLLVNDSKLVYSATEGLGELELSVLAILGTMLPVGWGNISDIMEHLCPAAKDDLLSEIWFSNATPLPLAAELERIDAATDVLRDASRTLDIGWGPVRSVVVCPSRFNDVVDRSDSKGAVLASGLVELLRWFLQPTEGRVCASEPVRVIVDKHGGRNFYIDIVSTACDSAMTLIREEGANRSIYDVVGLPHPLRLTFMPRADSSDLCVAVASMVSKYLRELFMHEFNGFWQKEVPGLVTTAGYPGDSHRFFSDIAPARERLRVADRQLWRQR